MSLPAYPVERLPRTPRPYGLFSVITPTSPGDPHWMFGITWIPQDPVVYVWDGVADPVQDKTFTPRNRDEVRHETLTVYASFSATLARNDDASGEALADLLAMEEPQVAAYLADLLDDAATAESGGDLITGMARAEALIDEHYGSRGIVYLTPELAVRMVEEGLVKAQGAQLQTMLGTPVAVLYGTEPVTEPAVYVSGDLAVYRSEAQSLGTHAAGRNDALGLAERQYVIQFDPRYVYKLTVA